MKLIKELTQLIETPAPPLRRGWYIVTVSKGTVIDGPFQNRAQAEEELDTSSNYVNKHIYSVKYVDKGDTFETHTTNEEKDPHAWVQKAVNKILDSGDRKALLDKPMRELIYIVQRAEDAGALAFTSADKLQAYIEAWREQQAVSESATTAMFTLQQRVGKAAQWEDLTSEKVTGKEAQEFLDADQDNDIEQRAISTDGQVMLKPSQRKRPAGKDVLARDASPEVHKRNREFFDKHL